MIVHDLDDEQRRAAYGADITYGTNNEFGFDYLRDNMKYDLANCVQRGHHFAIVDEVDSILIDEARTPLIISGPSEESTDKYAKINKIIPKLIQDIDYTIDEKHRQATLTEEGFNKCERLLGLSNMSDPANIEIMHHVYQGLRAHSLYKIDVDYVDERRRNYHRGRIHRTPDARPPLVRRIAPGRRSQRRREDRAREPDSRDHHVSELFPHVQKTFRHDRHGGNGSGGIRQNL